jgi:hypothetical protein
MTGPEQRERERADISTLFWPFAEAFQHEDIGDIMDMDAYIKLRDLIVQNVPMKVHISILDFPANHLPRNVYDTSGYLVYDDICSIFYGIQELYNSGTYHPRAGVLSKAIETMQTYGTSLDEMSSMTDILEKL